MRCIKLKSLTVTINVLFLLFFGSCDKTNSKHWTVVKINAQNYITGEPIEDVYCGVYTQKGGILNSGVEELDVSNTENGVYEFGFKAKKNKTYWAEAAIDIDKYYTVKFSNFMNLSNGETNEVEFELVSYAYLTFDIKNVSCFDSNDKLIFSRTSETGYNGYTDVIIDGCYEDSSGAFGKVPMGKWFFEWQVTKNSTTNTYYDTIELEKGEYRVYELDY
ncbi:MAG: hypothetical protein WDZ35_12130 [Crocinitomicaceae bacterium]